MNVCCHCLIETNTNDCPQCLMHHSVVPVAVFLDGCNLEELIAAREHWLALPERFRADHDTWQKRLFRFDKWIDRVRRSSKELRQTTAKAVVSDLLDTPIPGGQID